MHGFKHEDEKHVFPVLMVSVDPPGLLGSARLGSPVPVAFGWQQGLGASEALTSLGVLKHSVPVSGAQAQMAGTAGGWRPHLLTVRPAWAPSLHGGLTVVDFLHRSKYFRSCVSSI